MLSGHWKFHQKLIRIRANEHVLGLGLSLWKLNEVETGIEELGAQIESGIESQAICYLLFIGVRG